MPRIVSLTWSVVPLGSEPAAASKPAGAPACGVELAQEFAQLVRHGGDDGSRGRAIWKGGVLPQMAQHLEQVRLAAAEEAADPCGFLVGLAQTVEVRADDPLHAVGVLAFAHERREFAAQLFERLCVLAVDDPRLPLVDQREGPDRAAERP
jgi:hypothetical protein